VLADNFTYFENKNLVLDPPPNQRIAIEAADGSQPHVVLSQPIEIACAPNSTVTLSGLLIEGAISITQRDGTLRLLHTTLVPDSTASSITATPTNVAVDRFRLQIAFSISGALTLPPASRGVTIVDSIIDGVSGPAIAGPSLHIERSTVFGTVDVRELPMASETIFTDVVHVERRQQGCVRFSFVPDGSRTPRRYRCQPDLEIRKRADAAAPAARAAIAEDVREFLVPSFTSTHYPDPGYAQLHRNVPRQIFTGAEDFSEMGVYCHLKQPQRETNLRARIQEHLPFGFEAGLIYVT
jgi:hypothetical protein